MCTIGVVFHGTNIHTFKQCDLIPVVDFNLPESVAGKNGVQSCIEMTRSSGANKRMWAGVNSSGVAFVAADAYTTSANYYATDEATSKLFQAYEDSILKHDTVVDAAASLEEFYQTMGGDGAFPAPDISMLTGFADKEQTRPMAIFIEYMPRPYLHSSVRTIVRTDGFFASTNHFRIQPEAIHYPANHSTYLRLARAEAILQQNPTHDGIVTLLQDQYYGKCELSICRETDYIGEEYHTQATAVFSVAPGAKPVCEYQVNGNPKSNPLQVYQEHS